MSMWTVRKNKDDHFGEVCNGVIGLNEFGCIAQKYWSQIPNYYENVDLDEFVIMPNHIHGIIIIHEDDPKYSVGAEHCSAPGHCSSPGYRRTEQCSVRTGLLSRIIKSYKEVCTKHSRNKIDDFDFTWQRSPACR